MPDEPHENLEVILPAPGEQKKSIKFPETTSPQEGQIKTSKVSQGQIKTPKVSQDGQASLETKPKENSTSKEKPKSKKGRKKGLRRAESTGRRLQRVMKPLTQKCIPDKDPKPPFLAIKRKPLPLKRNSTGRSVTRKNSDLVFVMPKVQDFDEIRNRKTIKMVHKLIKYMKKSWKVKVDPKQAERELLYRTINTVTTTKPDNWKELIDQREQTAVETGFFCGFDGPYESLIDLELDTPMLVFNNLPPDLRITATRWLRDKANKEELKKKRDAYLPRVQRNQIKRPSFARGRLFKDPGGTIAVDKFVQTAERFQKLTKGSASYAKVLTDYAQRKEDENENSNSGFGAIRGPLKYGFEAASSANEVAETGHTVKNEMDENSPPDESRNHQADSRRDSIIDGRKYQREMLTMEYMVSALYDIVKSVLNIKNKQLSSMLPLPKEVVMQLRAKSPETKKSKKLPPISLLKRAKRNPGVYTNVGTLAFPSPVRSRNKLGDSEEEMSDEYDCIDMDQYLTKIPGLSGKNSQVDINEEDSGIRKDEAFKGLRKPSGVGNDAVFTLKPGPAAITVGPIKHPGEENNAKFTLPPMKSSVKLVQDIKRVHAHREKMSMGKNKKTLNSEQKIKTLLETPEHAAMRMARNAATYTKLFERHQRTKPPIWHSVHADNFSSNNPSNGMNQPKDPTHLTEADADEMVEMAMRKRHTMQSDRRWPNESQILTPTFPFSGSMGRIGSDEQSRRDLIAKTGNLNAIPSTPVRRLYKLAGVRTTDKQVFNTLLNIKRSFKATEKKVKVYYENEIGKIEWDTVKRFRSKLNAITPDPVYQWTLAIMRQATMYSIDDDEDDGHIRLADEGGIKRQALWYRRLLEECSSIGAVRHNGCQVALSRLIKFCDVDLKSKQHMLSRLALLVVSLPTTELGTRHWQQAILFLLEHLYGAPQDILYQWLNYRGLPFLF